MLFEPEKIKVTAKPLLVSLETYDSELLDIYEQAKNEVKNGESDKSNEE